MTQPQNPQDPFGSSTRRFDPDNPTTGYYPPDQYPPTGQYGDPYAGQTGQYATGGGNGGNGGGGLDGRTKALIGTVIGGLLVLLLIAFLVSVVGGRGGDDPAPATSSTTTTEETTTSETSTPSPTPTETTPQYQPGQVTYRLIGDGDLIGVRFSANGIQRILATVRSPWSQTDYVDGFADFNGIVIRGSVTCQILAGGKVLAEGQSSGGALHCSADLPEE
ncbi:MAG: hypothetical protein QM728_00165 [Gordonia sp. (in: high G+C Gram-positive bacteria)]|uniref:hypothetical protein n=1 Tax=Gordonia sp. (in: high G+C Gram-positive bacteria) TaxID=84139 RepID=UPI0039E55E98